MHTRSLSIVALATVFAIFFESAAVYGTRRWKGRRRLSWWWRKHVAAVGRFEAVRGRRITAIRRVL